MSERPALSCPKCGKPSRKVPSLFAMKKGSTVAGRMALDVMKKEREARASLSRDYGVEKIAPLRGQTISDVHRDVKSRGNFVREEMSRNGEETAKKNLAKRREWAVKANRRAAKRGREMQQRKAAENCAKRRIVV
jgi:hypothetical protein